VSNEKRCSLGGWANGVDSFKGDSSRPASFRRTGSVLVHDVGRRVRLRPPVPNVAGELTELERGSCSLQRPQRPRVSVARFPTRFISSLVGVPMDPSTDGGVHSR